MYNEEKILIAANIIIDIVAIVFTVFLKSYCDKILSTRMYYESVFMWAWNAIKDPDYIKYFVEGIFIGVLILIVLKFNIKNRIAHDIKAIIMIIFNIGILIALIIVFSNPIITVLLIVVAGVIAKTA